MRDDELEGYTGREYAVRIAICSVLFAATWFIYYGLSAYFGSKTLAEIQVLPMAGFVLAMVVVGATVSLSSLELEIGQSVMHYLGYFLVTFSLAWMSGVEMAEPLSTPKAKTVTTPSVVPRRVQPTKKQNVAPKQPQQPATSPQKQPTPQNNK